MANFNLNSVALICEFNSSVWTARKLDRKKSDEVVSGAGAAVKGAARVNKDLLAGRPELAAIATLVTEARNYVYDNTIPWSDNGQRLLVGTRFPKFNARIEAFRDRFNEMVADFVALYPSLITAQAMALGDMFNRAEFPQAAEIARKFDMTCEYIPVPVSGDIRVDVGNQAQDELRERLEKMAEVRISKAVSEVHDKFTSHLKRMADRLVTDTNAATGEVTGRRFTETLVSGAFELCDLVADYNLQGDPVLTQARQALESALAGVTVVSLREDPVKREDVRKAVTGILGQFQL